MRAYPNLHPLIARRLGIRMIYAPPLRPARSMVTPIRPLVVRWSHAVLFEPTHETETALNAAPLIF